jgi:hypothetical protein
MRTEGGGPNRRLENMHDRTPDWGLPRVPGCQYKKRSPMTHLNANLRMNG